MKNLAKLSKATGVSDGASKSTIPFVSKKIRFLKNKPSKARKLLKAVLPSTIEQPHKSILVTANKCNPEGKNLLKNLKIIRSSNVEQVNAARTEKLKDIFLDSSELEYLSQKHLANQIVVGSSTKKHPLRLIIARFFDNKLYDLFEFDVLGTSPISLSSNLAPIYQSKPVVLLLGVAWDSSSEMQAAGNTLANFLGGPVVSRVYVKELDNFIICTSFQRAHETVIKISHFKVDLTNQNSSELSCINTGFELELQLKRSKLPDAATAKRAAWLPPELFNQKKSTVKTDDLLNATQRVHITAEPLNTMKLRH